MTSPMPLSNPPDRAEIIQGFLSAAGWGQAQRTPLAGDASRRRYERLTQPSGNRAILMDAPPETGEDTGPFAALARHLRALGLSAPEIMAEDRADGLLLLEDLGDALYARVVITEPSLEDVLYSSAVDLLAALHSEPPPPEVGRYGPTEMGAASALAVTWYAKGIAGRSRSDMAPDADALSTACHDALRIHAGDTPVLALRDYHAENLIWLPDRKGVARVGLLDFQDGQAGHPGYDLVSLLSDARRDVPPNLAAKLAARYARTTGQDAERFAGACAVLSAQRNLRILGVFARLSLHFGKPAYVDLIPRVWRHLQADLTQPAAAELRAAVADLLPPPEPAGLARLRAEAGTCPTL